MECLSWKTILYQQIQDEGEAAKPVYPDTNKLAFSHSAAPRVEFFDGKLSFSVDKTGA